MEELASAWKDVKDKSITDLIVFLRDRCDLQHPSTVEDFRNIRSYAELALAVFDYSEYLRSGE